MYDPERDWIGFVFLCVCLNFRQIRRAIITLLGCNSFDGEMLDRCSFIFDIYFKSRQVRHNQNACGKLIGDGMASVISDGWKNIYFISENIK